MTRLAVVIALVGACGSITNAELDGGVDGSVVEPDAAKSCNTRLVFQKDEDLFTIRPDGSQAQNLTDSAEVEELGLFSPNGSKILYRTKIAENFDIYTMNADGSGKTQVTRAGVDSVSFSAWLDETRVIYLASVEGLGNSLLAVNTDGSERQLLASDVNLIGTLSISSAGRVLFGRGEQIFSVQPDGTDETQLPALNVSGPSFSPDGSRIVFHRNDDIFVMNADGTAEINLTPVTAERGILGRWFQDGQRIYFIQSIDSADEIFVMNSDGTSQRNVTNTPGSSESFVILSPSGQQFSFVADGLVNVIGTDGLGRLPLAGTEGGLAFSWQACQ